MKKYILIILAFGMFGCTASQRTELKHFQSNLFGLEREITLYSNNGQVIQKWQTKSKVENFGGSISFLDFNGKSIGVSGTYTVIEK